jgi:anthranilate phosphoribosyltransferase
MDIQHALNTVINQQDLTRTQMRGMMQNMMSGNATEAQMAGFLVALRCKGESVEEITAAAQVMRELATPVVVSGEHLIDTCGTGGDGTNTFNISTTCAFVVAAAGGKVAKHGNRSVSSKSGSADVLEAAGVNLNLTAAQVAVCIEKIGVGFLFAPKHHGAMQHTSKVRKDMGVRTLFNLLGPLSNPAAAPNQLMGVYDKRWLEPMAHVLKNLGSQHVLVVCAEDGLDEISLAAPTSICELNQGVIENYTLTPEQFGFTRRSLADLAVTDAPSSLAMMQAVLHNESGTAQDIVLFNAGAAIYAANLTDSLAAGIEKARQVLANGHALEKLQALIALTNSFA